MCDMYMTLADETIIKIKQFVETSSQSFKTSLNWRELSYSVIR